MMTPETLVILAFSTLFAVVGFLFANMLNNIAKALDRINLILEGHSTRIAVLETKCNLNHAEL